MTKPAILVFFVSVVFDFETWLRVSNISHFTLSRIYQTLVVDMSDKEAGKGKESPAEKAFRTPGLRGAQTTTLFRAVNPELFIKPVRTEPKCSMS